MADAKFEQASGLEEIQEQHTTFIQIFNTTNHWAHRNREDEAHTPVAVLGFRQGRSLDPGLLDASERHLATAGTNPYRARTRQMWGLGTLRPEFLGEPNEDSFGAPDIAQPIRVFVLNYFVDELRAKLVEPSKRIVKILHGEHDP